MAVSPLVELQQHGQRVWYDHVGCDRLDVGELARLVTVANVSGVLLHTGGCAELPDERLVEDARAASDVVGTIYERTGRSDGFVSVALSPKLAHDGSGTVVEALRLLDVVDRPNVMVRVPVTASGVWAIEELIAAGVSVDAGPVFSAERYAAVAHAYLTGLERRVREDRPLAGVASIVSFLAGRLDRLVDTLLRIEITATQDDNEASRLRTLLGQAGIAHAKIAYATFKTIVTGPRWEAVAARGASVQRLLWANAAPPNPALGDVYYVERLIGRNTVTALTVATLAAFRDGGRVQSTLEDGLPYARAVRLRLEAAGIHLERIARCLDRRGLHPSSASLDQVVGCVTSAGGGIR